MITHMHIENFKCFEDFDIDLDPFNVLIGPNDSGKTAFLMAIRLLAAWTGAGKRPPGGGTHCLWRGKAEEILVRAFVENGVGSERKMAGEFRTKDTINHRAIPLQHPEAARPAEQHSSLGDCMGRIAYYRLDPFALREKSPVTGSMDEVGRGFPTYLDDILRVDRNIFHKMESTFYQRFPLYSGLVIEKTFIFVPVGHLGQDEASVPQRRRDAFQVAFRTREGQTLPAQAVSDGVMLSLAFIAMAYAPDPPAVMLIEEPENGIHHASLKETIDTLKALSKDKGVQIILTTHSPYLLDHVEPDQVRVFWKDEEGAAHAFPLSKYPEIDKLKKHFMTGEMWTGLLEDLGEEFYKKLGAGK